MATLVSPGVDVTIVDESNYLPAATNSVPYILLATAENKISGTGTGVAAGTLKVNAGRVYLITSQRDLAATFGNPFFYQTAAGTPINGYELNEYGLLAAHSVLGISNRAYIQRADIDLSELTASLVRPTGAPANGTHWLDTSMTEWGIFEWNETTGAFTVQTPIVITDSDYVTGSVPNQDVGSIGDYAVVATNNSNPVYYKNSVNDWVLVGSDDWKTSWATVQGSNTVTGAALTSGNTLVINGNNVVVPVAGTLASLVTTINSTAITGVTAAAVDNKLTLYADSSANNAGNYGTNGLINIGSGSTAGLLTTLGLTSGNYNTPVLQASPNYTVPRWRSTDPNPKPSGSIWNVTTPVNQGTSIVFKTYNAVTGTFTTRPSPVYENDAAADNALDPAGGGKNLPINTSYVQYNSVSGTSLNTFTMTVLDKWQTGATIVAGDQPSPVFSAGSKTFTLSASAPGSSSFSAPVNVTFTGTTPAAFITAVSAANVPYVSASVTSAGTLAFTHSAGGSIIVDDTSGSAIADAGFNTSVTGVRTNPAGGLILSPWQVSPYTASSTPPDQDPDNGRYWFYSAVNQVDIMIQNDGSWNGYQNVTNDVRGYDLSLTNPTGPIVAATAPTTQSDGTTPLAYGDLWVDTADLENYPKLYRWTPSQNGDYWELVDNSDQTTSEGILFADARWATNGTTNPITDPFPLITNLLTSDYLDLDAPNPALYPEGTLLWNTRRSGYNVKAFRQNYFSTANGSAVDYYSNTTSYVVGEKVLFNGVIYVCIAGTTGNVPTDPNYWAELQTNAWVTASGNMDNGAPYMGRKAQRQIVVAALKSAIDTQDTLREEQQVFNLIACPQYPELIPNMVALNNERSNTGFVIGDTPLRLGPDQNNLVAWATNSGDQMQASAGLGAAGESGITVSDPYLAVFYPQCQTTDLSGNQVVQPASHMMLRTIVRSDEVAFPWIAPAGVRRGLVDNAERIGYINGLTGEFVTIATGQGVRDVLYENKINPITFIPGAGITNFGNKTEYGVSSALNRINVARLVAFIRGRLNEIGKQFVFEPNDQITRNEISNAISGLMQDLVAKRGIYDYLIICDESNNTPARIDRNELWVDIAIEPVKAVEFIYIPVRIKNTGEIAGGAAATGA